MSTTQTLSPLQSSIQASMQRVESTIGQSNVVPLQTTNITPTANTTPSNQNNSSPSLNQAFVNSAKQFYQAAVEDGYTYNNIDPIRDRKKAKGMDCCTGPWNFLANYLTKEDFDKLEPLKDYAYVNKGTLEERTAGFSGAIKNAGLGKSFKVDTTYVNSLKGKTSEQINQELTGKIFTYSGTNDKTGEGEGHVAIISKAWKDEKGNIKFEILGPHNFNKKVQEGNNSGIGTSTQVEDLSYFLKPNKSLTLATINDDVIQRAEKANAPQNRSGAGSSTGAIVYAEMTKQIANA